jgi:hypothetical protein
VVIGGKVSQLHQQSKFDSTLMNKKELLISRNVYLDRNQFRDLGSSLVRTLYELESKYMLKKRCATRQRFRRLLFTSFFVLIPVQRLRVIFELRWKDISMSNEGNGGVLQIGIEKTSFSKLGRSETIGRTLYIPEVLCGFLKIFRDVMTNFRAADDYV